MFLLIESFYLDFSQSLILSKNALDDLINVAPDNISCFA